MKRILLLLTVALSGCVTVTQHNDTELRSDPKEMAESRIALGLGYLEQGDMLKARENLEKAVRHAPNYYRSQLSLAHYFEQVGEEQLARDIYRKTLRQHPRNGNVLNNYGAFLCKEQEYELADEYFNRAIKQPYYYLISASFENAALCSLKAGNTQQARNYFERTLDHDPYRARSMLHLSKIEIESGDYTDARIRLMKFHQRYGLQKTSLKLLVQLESDAGNDALKIKYQNQLDQLS